MKPLISSILPNCLVQFCSQSSRVLNESLRAPGQSADTAIQFPVAAL